MHEQAMAIVFLGLMISALILIIFEKPFGDE